MEKVSTVLEEVSAALNNGKCMFFSKEVEYVELLITININPSEIKVTSKLPEAKDLK